MKFTHDSHFLIGHMHLTGGKPCQDYVLSGLHDDAPYAYAVLSDGCSTGGRTDVGARIVALATAQILKHSDYGIEHTEHIATARTIATNEVRWRLGIETDDMLATSVCVSVSPEGGFIFIEGDGVVALKRRNGELMLMKFEWAGNKPFYPAYRDNLIPFLVAHGNDLTANRLYVTVVLEGTINSLCFDQEKSLLEGITGITVDLDPENLDLVAVFSDGICQIDGIDWVDAVKEALAFKSTAGQFVVRRLNRMVKDLAKAGHRVMDDLSCAAVLISHE